MASSKQTNGKNSQTLAGKYHAKGLTTIKSNVVSSKPASTTAKIPETPSNEEFVDEGTSTNFKVFQQISGLPNDVPVTIMNSEFLPIYQGDELNDIGKILNVKEQAKLLTAKNAITLMTSVPDVEKYIDENVKKINELTDLGEGLIEDLLSKIIEVNRNISVRRNVRYPESSLFILGTSKGAKRSVGQSAALKGATSSAASESFESIADYLEKKNFQKDDIAGFTATKLWLQALVELKFTLTMASVGVSNSKLTQRSSFSDIDKDPNLISVSVGELPKGDYGKTGTFWLNNRIKSPVPTAAILSQFDMDVYLSSIVVPFMTMLRGVGSNAAYDDQKSLFVSHPYNGSAAPGLAITPTAANGFYATNIAILSNILQREKEYGKLIKNYANTLSNDYGFTPTANGSNVAIWDYLVGRFTDNAQDFVENPIGNGRSLTSLSNAYYPAPDNERYKVLTFEDEQPNPNEKGVTPGVSYYIDSSLSTIDGISFNTERLKQLRQKLNYSLQTCNIIEDFINLDTSLKSDTFLPRKIANRLSAVVNIYNYCFLQQDNGDIVFDRFKIKDLSDEDNRIRFFAMAAKNIIEGFSSSNTSCLQMIVHLYTMCVIFSEASAESQTLVSSNENYVNAVKGFIDQLWRNNFAGSNPDKSKYNRSTYLYGLFEKTILNFTEMESFFLNRDTFWIEFMKLFKEEYDEFKSDAATNYSGIDKHVYMFMHVVNMLYVIASMTPEVLYPCMKKIDVGSTSNGSVATAQLVEQETGQQIPAEIEDAFVSCHFYAISSYNTTFFPTITYSEWYKVNKEKNTITAKNLVQSVDLMRDEMLEILHEVKLIKYFISNAKTPIDELIQLLEKNFTSYLQKVFPLFASNNELTQRQKDALFNMSLAQEQLSMAKYVLSEVDDRIAENDAESKLASFPSFFDFPKNFGKFLPLNDAQLLSFTTLSTYFKSNEFQKTKGGNKRILSVGIPPKMTKKLLSFVPKSTADAILSNIVRFRIWKVDLLNPILKFLPQSYLFELNRFPTRSAANWNFDAFAKDADILQVPTKYLTINEMQVHKSYADAFISHGNLIDTQKKLEIYSNHAKSYLLEEYIKWFTDVDVDETRYYNYEPMKQTIQLIESSYGNFTKAVSAVNKPTGKVNAKFIDPVSGQTYSIPTQANNQEYSSNALKGSKNSSEENKKVFDLDMTETMMSYLSHETLLMPYESIANRCVYPKKFDRTFSIIFDPDDFIVDVTDIRKGNDQEMKNAIDKLINEKFLVSNAPAISGYQQSNLYRTKEQTQNDVYMNEYFVTVEPYIGSNKLINIL